MAHNNREDILDFIKRNPGLPATRICNAFRTDVRYTLLKLEQVGLIESKKEFNGIGRAWEVKCYYLVEGR